MARSGGTPLHGGGHRRGLALGVGRPRGRVAVAARPRHAASGLEHAPATYAAGGAAAVLLGTVVFAAWGVDLSGGSQSALAARWSRCARR